MRALVFDGRLTFRNDYPTPQPKNGEALVRILMAGICDTDLQITRGYKGFHGILGHEFVGTVENVKGTALHHLMGKRVVGDINCGCGTCPECLAGNEHHCPNRTTIGIFGHDGAFADYLAIPVNNLAVVPDTISDEAAVFVEPLAAAFEILEQVHITPTKKILVMGDGKLGIMITQVLSLSGAGVILTGKHTAKLSVARKLGISTVNIKNVEPKDGFHIVVDATGSAEAFRMAMEIVKPRGTIVLKTTTATGPAINLAPLVVKEVSVVGSRCGPFAPALEALSKNSIDVRPLITAVYPFSQAREAMRKAALKGSLKVLLDFHENGR